MRLPFKNEGEFRRALGEAFRSVGFEFQPIESGSTGNGIPDAYYSGYHRTFSGSLSPAAGWLELKNAPKRSIQNAAIYSVKFRPGQVAWLNRYAKAGTNCALLIAFSDGIVIKRYPDIKSTYTGDELRQSYIAEPCMFSSLIAKL